MMKTFLEILESKIQADINSNFNEYNDASTFFYDGTQEAQCFNQLLSYGLKSKLYKPKKAYNSPESSLQKMRQPIDYTLSETQKRALDFINHYLLETEKLVGSFSLLKLKKRFRQLAKQLHPDQGGTADGFRELNTHYKILLDFLISIK